MMELLASLMAALFGVLLDHLGAWHTQRKANQNALELTRLRRRVQIDRVNARIDREVANEKDLGLLLDRL
ncbi:MAG: hypothetical protein Rhims3KO_03490 [Hyphomicrobiales bacterium]